MSIKDIVSQSEVFAKLAMKRVAQDPFGGLRPEEFTQEGSFDKLFPELSQKLKNEKEQAAAKAQPGAANTQAPSAAPAQAGGQNAKTAPQAAKSTVMPASMLGAALPKSALDLLAPYKGKGLLNVQLAGKDLKVIYNSRGMHDTALQGKLQSALPGFTVSVLGQTDFPAANY